MTTHLINSDWIVSFLNGRRTAVALFEAIGGDGIAVSAISWGEVVEGAYDYDDSAAKERQLADFSRNFDIMPVNAAVATQYASIRRHLRAEGRLIPDNDLWIAPTALRNDLILVSRDEHFKRVPGIKIYQEIGA